MEPERTLTEIVLNRQIRGPRITPRKTRRSPVVRFLEKVEINPRGCWLWKGGVRSNGYGHVTDPRSRVAHRLAYILFVGELVEDQQVDHLCRIPACVNPDHLEAVDAKTNIARSAKSVWACDQLHPKTQTRIGVRANGWEWCRECQRVRENTRRYKWWCSQAGQAWDSRVLEGIRRGTPLRDLLFTYPAPA